MKNNNEFTQNNGMTIKEGKIYMTLVGDKVKVLYIKNDSNTLKVFNLSDQCNSWHRIDAAIKDNKFREEV